MGRVTYLPLHVLNKPNVFFISITNLLLLWVFSLLVIQGLLKHFFPAEIRAIIDFCIYKSVGFFQCQFINKMTEKKVLDSLSVWFLDLREKAVELENRTVRMMRDMINLAR